jgi:hypothetical protein
VVVLLGGRDVSNIGSFSMNYSEISPHDNRISGNPETCDMSVIWVGAGHHKWPSPSISKINRFQRLLSYEEISTDGRSYRLPSVIEEGAGLEKSGT